MRTYTGASKNFRVRKFSVKWTETIHHEEQGNEPLVNDIKELCRDFRRQICMNLNVSILKQSDTGKFYDQFFAKFKATKTM